MVTCMQKGVHKIKDDAKFGAAADSLRFKFAHGPRSRPFNACCWTASFSISFRMTSADTGVFQTDFAIMPCTSLSIDAKATIASSFSARFLSMSRDRPSAVPKSSVL
ncbi:hypothetical protein ACTXT7_017287 [Hymenolepis weldensis]